VPERPAAQEPAAVMSLKKAPVKEKNNQGRKKKKKMWTPTTHLSPEGKRPAGSKEKKKKKKRERGRNDRHPLTNTPFLPLATGVVTGEEEKKTTSAPLRPCDGRTPPLTGGKEKKKKEGKEEKGGGDTSGRPRRALGPSSKRKGAMSGTDRRRE